MNINFIDGVTQKPLREWLGSFFDQEGITQEPLKFEPLSLTGGEMGEVFRVRNYSKSVIVKCPNIHESRWAILLEDAVVHDREVFSYRFIQEKFKNPQIIAPNCIWSRSTSEGSPCLVLEDLKDSDPIGLMAQGLSCGQIQQSISTLCTLHKKNLNFLLKSEFPYRPWMLHLGSRHLSEAIKEGILILPDLIDDFQLKQKLSVVLKKDKNDILSVMKGAKSIHNIQTFCHGDIWAGNIIFEGEDISLPTSAKLLDWQFSLWSSPLTDVGTLILSSLSTARRRADTNSILNYYYTCLEVDERKYSFLNLKTDFERVVPYCILTTLSQLDGYYSSLCSSGKEKIHERLAGIIEDYPDFFS